MIIGITGGVGTGKSAILDHLEQEYGARIIMADEVAKFLQAPGGRCYGPIVEEFGEEILDKTQEGWPIDRAKLAGIVYSDPERLEDLNFIVHPLVKIEIMCEISGIYHEDSEALIFVEAALLIEAGYLDFLDELWVVETDLDVRLERLAESRGYSRERALEIMEAQLKPEEYAEFADFIINNSGDFEVTAKQIRNRLSELDLLDE